MTQTMKKRFQTIGLAAALALAVATPAGAVDINGGLTSGVLNTIEDQDREAFIDNGDGVLGVGDVFIGFVRLDNFLPSGLKPNDTVYGIISNQIVAVDPGATGDTTIFSLGTTTVAGLTLAELTGDLNATGGMFAIYDGIAPSDLISNAIGADDIFDYLDYINNGVLRLVTGIVSADNYLMVDNGVGFPAGTSTGLLAITPVSVTTGSFTGGLDILYNFTNFTYLDAVLTVDALGVFHTTPVGIGNGSVRGAIGDGYEAAFGNASTNDGTPTGFTQCTVLDQAGAPTPVTCGFVTDADFFVVPRIPEPGSLALFGAALLAGFAVRRRMKSA